MNAIAILLAAMALWIADPALAQLTPKQILERVDEVRSLGPHFRFTVDVVHTTGVNTVENEFEVWVRDSRQSLVLYRKPVAQRGRALLLDGQNMWIYIPGTSRALRISPQQQLLGNVTNADVARVVFSLDYSAESAEPVRADDGSGALKLRLSSIEQNVPYRKIELWVSAVDYRPVRADFFAISGKLLRTAHYRGYREVHGKLRPTILEITSPLSTNEKTVMSYSRFEVRETPAEYYQPSFLSRLK